MKLSDFDFDLPNSLIAQYPSEKRTNSRLLVLQNDFIEVKTEMSEEIKSDIPYTPKDKFNKMIEENPSLKTLQQKLGLDPEY